jgi:hypothetical protein
MAIREEEILQAACYKWFTDTYPGERQMMHCNNNGSANWIKGALNASMGVVPGVSDLEWALPGRVIFIEMKTPTGTQSDAQKDFMRKVMERGHQYIILRSLEEFKQFVWQNIGK